MESGLQLNDSRQYVADQPRATLDETKRVTQQNGRSTDSSHVVDSLILGVIRMLQHGEAYTRRVSKARAKRKRQAKRKISEKRQLS